MPSHVLSLLVENKPGLLTRVAGLFARRGFNIESLAVGVTEVPGLSRITVVVDVEELPLEQVTKQLNKLVNVIKIVELDPSQSVQRDHLLVKVRADNATRSNVIEVVNLFRASIVDYRPTHSELGALVLENRLIKEWRPTGNKALKRTDQWAFIRCRLDIEYPVLEAGADPQRALSLARMNLEIRRTPRARELHSRAMNVVGDCS